ncbi:helix-turn-helix domain-containing protein [Desulfofustis limnaeus]|uniref:HTH cro/C1-type domain-containing protein n=1 Tax=Desulfofustis limnaeus TaxID=2740163 RepID=A0ABN6M745_9BACT|nr:helix-turn-helix domain-containing protein [Desulfofustis limnaeus]BDD88713.1 hypothetical protein DPPLL_30780 [Desulfofustis limnaeus]
MTVKLTTQHPASSYGVPVFVDDNDNLLDYYDGIRRMRAERGWSTQDLADKLGKSRRTVEGWEQGRMPDKTALLLLSRLL